MVKVGAVGAIDVSAIGPFALNRPDILKMVSAFESRLAKQALIVPVQVAFVGHAGLHAFR